MAPGFTEFFRAATEGREPYAYQRALGEMERSPSVLAVPTGSGKTHALLVSWLYGRRVRGTAPRRLVYALPMRSLVEQTFNEATTIRKNLGLDEQALDVRMLMGGVEPETLRDWRAHPEQDQILIGTIDMLLSRALNRGFAESRFAWPISFGLLNADCRWVFDEVQLMGVAAKTSAQLDGLRTLLGVARPCESTWVSATVDESTLITVDRPQLGEVLGLPSKDAAGPLRKRLDARKTLKRVNLEGLKASELAGKIAASVLEHHQAGTRSIVVLNRVELAQQTMRALVRALDKDTDPELVLLHSRFRSEDRARHMEQALAEVDGEGPGRIVVATQVIEAGVDTSSALLATETASFSSIVQRIGRCNRAGEVTGGATVLWLDRGELDAKRAAPYDPIDLARARETLGSRLGESLSPNTLSSIQLPVRRDPTATLRRRDLIDLFDTAPDLSGMDVDVSRFIRDDDERSISVFFRELGENSKGIAEQPAGTREELVQVPIGSLGERPAWIHDYVEERWKGAKGRAIRPGMTVMLAAIDGGYDERLGWRPESREPVSTREPEHARQEESFGSNEPTLSREWIALQEHLDDARRYAEVLIDTLGELDAPPEASRSVIAAAALHDVGKAHPAFQEMLLKTSKGEQDRPESTETIWAKSAHRGGRNRRRHFRHELASALSLKALDTSAQSMYIDDLTLYLVAAHHGRVRMSIRPAPEERRPSDAADGKARFALGIVEGDELPALKTPLGTLPSVTLDLSCMEMGSDERSWTAIACRLRDDRTLGPFRLAYLEALIRITDWRASDTPHVAVAHPPNDDALPPAVVRSAHSRNTPKRDEDSLHLTGFTADTLIGYLKALGLLRVVTRQVDAEARGRWAGGMFELSSTLDRASLASFLLERYIPTPVISPWNGGSGFFPKDNKSAMEAIATSDDVRLDPMRAAVATAREALSDLKLTEKPSDKLLKLRLLQELRARLGDDALEWLDATAALIGDKVRYLPLLGSGGNDGRFDFANNYAQSLVTSLGLPGTEDARVRAQRLLDAALDRTPAQLEKMSVGHFSRDASPVNSPSGESDGVGNPWDLVLAVEGSLLLAPGAARRHGVISETTMVAPFTVHPTAAGYGSAISGETGRAELWLPIWEAWTGLAELEAMTREARAQVGRRNARSGLDFARASSEMAVARGISEFSRFALLERAGQSTLAVPAGRIEVRERPAVAALRTIDHWIGRVQQYAQTDAGRATRTAVGRLEKCLFELAERGDPSSTCTTLEALGEVEALLAASAAGVGQDGVIPLEKVPARVWLAAADDGSAEFDIALSLASLHDHRASAALPAMRDYLHGTNLDSQGHRTYAGRLGRAAPRRANPLERLALIHRRRHLDVEMSRSMTAGTAGSSRDLSFARGIYCPLNLARRFARGDTSLDDARIMRLTQGMALLDFSYVKDRREPRGYSKGPPFSPLFDVLALAWAGTTHTNEHRDPDAHALHARPGWAALLAVGQPASVSRVLDDALLRMRMGGFTPLLTVEDLLTEAPLTHRFGAALLLRVSSSERHQIAERLTKPEAVQLNEGVLP